MNISSGFDVCPNYVRDISKQVHKYTYLLICSSVLNAVLAATATLSNGLIIVTILRSQNLQTPSYLLITSLAFTDLFIGLIYHPILVQISASFLVEKVPFSCRTRVFHYINLFLGGVSIMINMFISIDQYLALSLKHRYRIHVTKKRVGIAIVAGWVLPGCFVSVIYLLPRYSMTANLANMTVALVLIIVTCSFYIKSFFRLRRYTSQVQAQQPNLLHSNFDVVKYRKILKTMVAILGCYLVCLVALLVSLVTMNLKSLSINSLFIGYLIFTANSSINQVIYLTRFTDIRQGCRNLLKKLALC